jgi:hypothetical protein
MLHLDASRCLHMAPLKAWVASLIHKRPSTAWSSLITVERGQPVRFVCSADVSVTCVSGTAWITTAAETRDVVLEPSQRHVAARSARLFINGMPRCVLRFEPAARP